MSDKYLRIPIFNQRIYLATKEDAEKYCGLDGIENYEALCFIGYRDRICFYYSKSINNKTLVHESVHLANFIIDRCLIYSTSQHDEVQAYLTAYIYEKLKELVHAKPY